MVWVRNRARWRQQGGGASAKGCVYRIDGREGCVDRINGRRRCVDQMNGRMCACVSDKWTGKACVCRIDGQGRWVYRINGREKFCGSDKRTGTVCVCVSDRWTKNAPFRARRIRKRVFLSDRWTGNRINGRGNAPFRARRGTTCAWTCSAAASAQPAGRDTEKSKSN